MARPSGRAPDQLRPVRFTRAHGKHAEGSVLIEFGDTQVLCTASVEESVPQFLRGKNQGWITAEYGMLPRATHTRTAREAARGKQSGRTQEIQRLIGRSLRAITDLKALGERQIRIDCDVLQADGGTRTASITGSYVALHLALQKLVAAKTLAALPLSDAVAAISCGVHQDTPVLDLDYAEDSAAETDANFVLTGRGGIVEIQATAERTPFEEAQFSRMLTLARKGIGELVAAAKAKPGVLKFGSSGLGTGTHLGALKFNQEAGIKALHVPAQKDDAMAQPAQNSRDGLDGVRAVEFFLKIIGQ